MTMVWNQMARLTVVLVLLLGLTLVGPLATSAQNGGNSDAARACQKGKYTRLAPTEAPGTAFVSQTACVSYAARGGTLVPVVVADLSIVFVQTEPRRGTFTSSGSGLRSGSVITLDLIYANGQPTLFGEILGYAAADGTFTLTRGFSCGLLSSLTLKGIAVDGAPVSTSAAAPC